MFPYVYTQVLQLILRFVHTIASIVGLTMGFGRLSLAIRCLSSDGTLHFRVSIDETGLL
jgi:hypothetical protein